VEVKTVENLKLYTQYFKYDVTKNAGTQTSVSTSMLYV